MANYVLPAIVRLGRPLWNGAPQVFAALQRSMWRFESQCGTNLFTASRRLKLHHLIIPSLLMTDKMDPDEINPKWAQGDFFRMLILSKLLHSPQRVVMNYIIQKQKKTSKSPWSTNANEYGEVKKLKYPRGSILFYLALWAHDDRCPLVLGGAPETYGDDPSCLQVRVSGKCLRMTRRKVPATEEWSKLPPLEHVPHDKKLYSLSNRRLFIYRVLFHHHKLASKLMKAASIPFPYDYIDPILAA